MFVRQLSLSLVAAALLLAGPMSLASAQSPTLKLGVVARPSAAMKFSLTQVYLAHAPNTKVLKFAQSKLGSQVGRGESWDLAAEALMIAGARPAQGYNFGTVVTTPIAGDIIQFYNARFESPNHWFQKGAPHHTAVIESVSGGTIVILQQNTNGNRTVTRQSINLATKTQGSITFFRPIAK